MGSLRSRFRRQFKVDDPLVLDSNFRQGSTEHFRYIDTQIRDLQEMVLTLQASGVTATWFFLDQSSADAVAGDVVCSASVVGSESNLAEAQRHVTVANPTALDQAKSIAGIVLAAAPKNSRVLVATAGIVGAAVTGLPTGSAGYARVSSSGHAEFVTLIGDTDTILGAVDGVGNLTLRPLGSIVIEGGGAGFVPGIVSPVDYVFTGTTHALAGTTPVDTGAMTANVTRVLTPFLDDDTKRRIWVVQSGAWTFADDLNEDGDFVPGTTRTLVKSGTAANAGAEYQLISGTHTGPKSWRNVRALATTATDGLMAASDKAAHDSNTAYVSSRKAPVINVCEPGPWGAGLKGDNTDESATISAIFAYAATLTASGGCTLKFGPGNYRGFDNTEWPQFCDIELPSNAKLIRPSNLAPGCALRCSAGLNQGSPWEAKMTGGGIHIEPVGVSNSAWQPATNFTVGQVIKARDAVPHMRGNPSLTFNASAKTMTRADAASGGSFLQDLFTLSTSLSITKTVANNLTGAAIQSVTDATITFAPSVTIVNETVSGAWVIGDTPTVARYHTPVSHCLKLISRTGVTGAHLAIGELCPPEGVLLRGTAASDHQTKVKIIAWRLTAQGSCTIKIATDGVTYGSDITLPYDPRGNSIAVPGHPNLQIYFPYFPQGSFTAGQIISPLPRVEVLGVPPSDQTIVDVRIMTGGALGTMQAKIGFAYAAIVDDWVSGGGCDTVSPATQTSTGGAAYWDYAIPGTSLTVRFHAGFYSSSGSNRGDYFTPACRHSIMVGAQIVDGGHVWEVQPVAACVDLNAAGNITFERVQFSNGNIQLLNNQGENVVLRDCGFRDAAGAGWYGSGEGTVTPGASGGFTNTFQIEGRTQVTNEVYGGVHDGGYTLKISGAVTFQRATRGMLFIRNMNTMQIGPGIYSETSNFIVRDCAAFSRRPGSFAFQGMKLDSVLALGAFFPALDIRIANGSTTTRGLRVTGGCKLSGRYAIGGLGNVDDVAIDPSTTHHYGGPLVDVPGRDRYVTTRGGVLLRDMPLAAGTGGSKTISVGSNNNIAWTGGPKAIMHLGTTGAGVYTLTGFVAGEEGQELYIENNGTGVILELANNSGSSSAGNRIYTRRNGSVYLLAPGTPGRVQWARFRYMFTGTAVAGWHLESHSKSYNDGQSGSTTLVAGVSPAISAYLTSNSNITLLLRTPKSDFNTKGYAALPQDRVTGAPGTGTFKIRSLAAARMQGTPSLTFSTGPNKVVRSAGDWTTDGFANNDWIVIADAVNAANNCITQITALTATDATVSATLVAEGPTSGCKVAKLNAEDVSILDWFVHETG